MHKKRIVITGIGILSPIGIGKEQYWQSLKNGKSDFKDIGLFDTANLKVTIAGEIRDFAPRQIFGKDLRDWDRASLLLSAAVKYALEDAGITVSSANAGNIGVSVGTTFGSLYSISEFDKEAIREGPRYANPSVFTSTVGNSPASRVSILFGIKGFNTTISTGMCAALDALDYACDFLALDRAKTIIAGSVEALSPQLFLGFYKLNYLAGTRAGCAAVSCPFDRDRNGIVFSEGAAACVLEDSDAAQARKAQIYAQILGMGSAFDPARAYKYDYRGTGMKEAMRLAMHEAGFTPDDIDCVFANANSTQDADRIEAEAIAEVFKERAAPIAVTAVKSLVGETYSASGGMALAAAAGALQDEFIPPVANLRECDCAPGLDYVRDESRKQSLGAVMINAFGPNGGNTSVIIGRG